MNPRPEPKNYPSLTCVVCNNPAKPYETIVQNDKKELVPIQDKWPEYYRNVEDQRIEFCSCECGLKYCQNNGI